MSDQPSRAQTPATLPEALITRLAPRLEARLDEAQLPGDPEMSAEALAAAARFMLTSAARRERAQSAINIETVSGAAGERFMRIAVVNEDMPFLVDSIAGTVGAHGLVIDRLIHPIVPVERNGQGDITDLPEGEAPGVARESVIYLETPRADARTRAALAADLAVTLGDVRAAVGDWGAMRTAMEDDAGRLTAMDRAEGAALLRWFKDGMLTQLGHVTRLRDGSQQGALGICRKSTWELLNRAGFEQAFAWFDQFAAKGGGGRLPLIVKSNRIAHVHRRVPLDLFIVPVIEGGQVTALSVHAGVWTSEALASPPQAVPRMRAQLAALMEKFGFSPRGHAGKVLVHALTSLPHDQLIGFGDEDLERVSLTLMSIIDRPRPRLSLVAGPLGRHLYTYVWLPRETLSNRMRARISTMLEEASGTQVLDWSLEVEEGNLAQLRYVLAPAEGREIAVPDEAALDAQLQAMLRGWGDAVEAELANTEEPARAAAIAGRYAEAFPENYRALYGPAEAAIDIAQLRRVASGGDEHPRAVRLYCLPGSDEPERLRLKIYERKASLVLSDVVPALENFGFRVQDNVPTSLRSADLGVIHDFLLALPVGQETAPVLAHAPIIEDALIAVLTGAGEEDAFNRLIVGVGLSAREANWLRAWYRYLRQTGLNYSIDTAVDALMNAGAVTLGLVDLFRARHLPGTADRVALEAQAEDAIRDGLAKVSAINEDRLLRAFRMIVLAILRTNAFAEAGREALAFKFDSALVPNLPKPLPWREIFVYSRRVEGIHLRAGPVARGGLRWSDRRDDFRTEVLGLMKAQRVKNAVIVPTGAKGGFYPKQLPDPARDRDGWATEGRESYKVFIRTLLSITDNIVENKVVHPAEVVIRDGEDPYFVVAADKGTATFSDTANGLAAEKDFWLDDAFASGGSKGYDHKAMGITARGAWMSVQRHFLEMGVDVQADPVRVVGVGDMSGDVFGNGMLLSKSLLITAAFDHRHIFLDPNPDAAKSWEERNRLFALPRSSWDDYDRSVMSPGGAIVPRSQKEIPLSPEIRLALGIDAEVIDPDSLMTAILKAPVDLLWFGGIGTYVKAASEVHAAVGDPSNDSIRVNGAEVRARVIGEGGNLGCTQAGRIDYALHGANGFGGRGNTDFIDNSAGVDCSDKEVNIKIALANAKRAGRLDEDGRVVILSKMTDAVAALVLEDNRLQALGLSIAQNGGADAMPGHVRLIEMLEDNGQLDRRTEGLADADTFARRAADIGAGLTRPELAVLLSSAKLAIQDALEASTVVDDTALDDDLLHAFPEDMRETYREDILGHRLRREILATRLANRLINRLGFVHPFELAEEEGVGLAEVTAAFLAAEQLFGLETIWQAIEDAPIAEKPRILLMSRAADVVRSHMADLLRSGATTIAPSVLAADLAGGISALSRQVDDLLVTETRERSTRMASDLLAAGADGEQALAIVHLFDMDGAVGLAALAHGNGADPIALTRAFTRLGEALGLDWAQGVAARLSPADPWERLLVAGLARDFQQMRFQFLARADAKAPGQTVETWLEATSASVLTFRAMINRARKAAVVSPAMLAQIASQARNVLAR
ncbi:NAD-glutamate dehydrogenase domain-containing protein [Novosphingobium terrae]|uniref:NAD-glutamate dehydrogenase domain-containing protein n=1 Tax=Novosphingobium terrae TaxID=2726189 RepID=UPI00197D2D57|nr:NAD-glutamate dehydrogenase domain-containing protein [Novosphingobium terrae]